jgi:hypothetical protein
VSILPLPLPVAQAAGDAASVVVVQPDGRREDAFAQKRKPVLGAVEKGGTRFQV